MRFSTRFVLSLSTLFVFCLIPRAAFAASEARDCPAEPTQNVPIASGFVYAGPNCIIWVRLLWNDGPDGRIEPLLILLDVEFPGAIKISGKVDGSEFDDRLSHRLGPAHPGALHAV